MNDFKNTLISILIAIAIFVGGVFGGIWYSGRSKSSDERLDALRSDYERTRNAQQQAEDRVIKLSNDLDQSGRTIKSLQRTIRELEIAGIRIGSNQSVLTSGLSNAAGIAESSAGLIGELGAIIQSVPK